MPRDGRPTRNKILKHSKALVLERGFSGMSIDMIIQRTGISKGTFLYHFKTKNDLAKGLMDEYMANDERERTEALKQVKNIDDPLDRFLAFIQVFIDEFEQLESPYPGCLYASYNYEPNHFDKTIIADIAKALLKWQITIEEMLTAIHQKYDPALDIDKRALAIQFSAIFEGALIVSKAIDDASVTAGQLKQYKNYIILLYSKQ